MTPQRILLITSALLLGLASVGVLLQAGEPEPGTRPLHEVLVALGEPAAKHLPRDGDSASALRGLEILTRGRTLNAAGDSTPIQSPYFRCVDCHLLEREDPSLRSSDPAARLAYGATNRRRLLPAATLYGVVNKATWYDGYDRKYGDLVTEARTDLRAAIQLCARECSQGRALEPWELEAVLTHLWTVQYRVSDLDLAPEELARLDAALRNGRPDPAVAAMLRRSFLDRTPATFLSPAGFVAGAGDPEAGRAVFDRSCLGCHGPAGPSRFNMTTPEGRSDVVHALREGELLAAVRGGVPPPEGRRGRYMPEFTAERLSDGQLRDLFAWLGGLDPGAEDGSGNPAVSPADSARHDPVVLDPAAVTAGMQALTTKACGDCHGRKAGVEWIRFDYVEKLDRLAAQKKYVVPGRPDESRLYRMVAGLEKPAMPHKRAPLTAGEVALVRAWIAGLPPARP